MTGTGEPAIARATISTLNAQRSSIAARYVERRPLALDARGTNDEMRVGVPPRQHLDDVANRRTVERGDDPDLPRQRRQRPLAGGVEQAFGVKPLLQLIERQLQRAEPLGLEVLADELILAFGLVHRQAPACHHAHAVARLEFQIAERRPENHAAHLRAGVFQGEVQMAGVPDPTVRELALDPHLGQLGFQQIADADRQLRDGENPAGGHRRGVGRHA
jgi:hypothetical protein